MLLQRVVNAISISTALEAHTPQYLCCYNSSVALGLMSSGAETRSFLLVGTRAPVIAAVLEGWLALVVTEALVESWRRLLGLDLQHESILLSGVAASMVPVVASTAVVVPFVGLAGFLLLLFLPLANLLAASFQPGRTVHRRSEGALLGVDKLRRHFRSMDGSNGDKLQAVVNLGQTYIQRDTGSSSGKLTRSCLTPLTGMYNKPNGGFQE